MIQLTRRQKIAIGVATLAGAGITIAVIKRKRVKELVEYAGQEVYEAGEAVVEKASAAVEQATAVSQKVVEKATAIVKKIVAAVGGIPQFVIDNFNKNNLPELIEKYRGDFPWNLAAAIIQDESRGVADKVNSRSGATGIVQITTTTDRGITKEDRKDPEKSLKAIMPEWKRFLDRVKAKGITDPHEQWAWVYYGHNSGGGALNKALEHASEGLEKAVKYWRNEKLLAQKPEWTKEQWYAEIDKIQANRVAYARKVADTAVEWAVVEKNMKAGDMAAVLGSIVVEANDAVADAVYDQYGRRVG